MRTRLFLALALAVGMAAAAGYALQAQASIIKVDIPFEFTAGPKVLPAGSYTFERQGTVGEIFRIQGEGKNVAVANVITRLGAYIHTTPQDAHIVFDVVGGSTYILAEIWIPGQDGYVLAVTKEKHEHKVMNIQR